VASLRKVLPAMTKMPHASTNDGEFAGLLCDLDGVLRLWPKAHLDSAEQVVGLPPGSIRSVAFGPDLLTPAVTGRLSDEAWRQAITDRLQAAYPGIDVARAVAIWSAPIGEVNTSVRDLLRRRRVPVALVTNATSRLTQDLARLGLDAEVDYVINSSEIRVAKPEWGIFAAALNTIGLPAKEGVLFVDDHPGHVAAAESFGIFGHHFQNAERLEAALRETQIIR
jgi:putative hydrolase of the HAD superfamily